MHLPWRTGVFLLIAATLGPATGCGVSTVAKQAFYELRGAHGTILFIDELNVAELGRYRTIRFEPVHSTLGPVLCPPKLRRAYDRYAHRLALELRDEFPGGEPTLSVASEILYFQRKSLLSGAECLTRVRFTEGGQLVADGIVRVESKSFREGGTSDLAEASVETIGKVLKERVLPEKERDERD